MSEIQAACLWAQLEVMDTLQAARHALFQKYMNALRPLHDEAHITFPLIPQDCEHNAHIFYFEVNNPGERKALMAHMKERGITTAPHYVPLHNSEAGKRIGRFIGDDTRTNEAASRLVRLPLYTEMPLDEQMAVVRALQEFWAMQTAIE